MSNIICFFFGSVKTRGKCWQKCLAKVLGKILCFPISIIYSILLLYNIVLLPVIQ